jgi:Phosphotransferase enzyme family
MSYISLTHSPTHSRTHSHSLSLSLSLSLSRSHTLQRLVIKFYCPLTGGQQAFERESRFYQVYGSVTPLPFVPTLHCVGVLFPRRCLWRWPYLVIDRLCGRDLSSVRLPRHVRLPRNAVPSPTAASQVTSLSPMSPVAPLLLARRRSFFSPLVHQLAAALASLHLHTAYYPDPQGRRSGSVSALCDVTRECFARRLRRRHRKCADRHVRWSSSAVVRAQLRTWLSARFVDRLLSASALQPLCLVHGDLKRHNLLVEPMYHGSGVPPAPERCHASVAAARVLATPPPSAQPAAPAAPMCEPTARTTTLVDNGSRALRTLRLVALVDFGDSCVAPPWLDLVDVFASVLRCDAALFRDFLCAYSALTTFGLPCVCAGSPPQAFAVRTQRHTNASAHAPASTHTHARAHQLAAVRPYCEVCAPDLLLSLLLMHPHDALGHGLYRYRPSLRRYEHSLRLLARRLWFSSER